MLPTSPRVEALLPHDSTYLKLWYIAERPRSGHGMADGLNAACDRVLLRYKSTSFLTNWE
jgi:hypothetical protein